LDSLVVAAALASALLHAAWNAMVKASADPARVMAGQIVAAGLLVLPGALWLGLPPAAAWPWMAASSLLSVSVSLALVRAYEGAAFGVVYPVARASSVLFVLPLTAWAFAELPSALALTGVLAIVLALVLLALGRGSGARLPGRSLAWALLAAALTALYVVCDAKGARAAGSALVYGLAQSALNAVTAGLLLRSGGGALRAVVQHQRVVLPAALLSILSYLLILWVFTRAPVALGAALRDTSALFAAVIAVMLLGERLGRNGWLAVALASAGCLLIRLG
jgi:drug/metabolite transporter (DMT)-like permease